MPGRGEYFGSDAQRAMQRRAAALWELLKDDPRFTFMGRMIGLHRCAARDVPLAVALARAQGAFMTFSLPEAEEVARAAALRDAGLITDRWDLLMGGEPAITACRTFLDEYAPPEELALVRVTPETDPALMRKMAETALASGVLPPVGASLRGETREALCLLAVDANGDVAALSGACKAHHPETDWADTAWWGMLATRDDWRGRRLSLWLGALALTAMADEFGARRFYTGVRSDNAPSQNICRKLGLGDSGLVVLSASDPEAFGDEPLTK